MEVNHFLVHELLGYWQFSSNDIFLELSNVKAVRVVHLIPLPVNEEEKLVLKLINSACVDSRVDEAQFANEKVRDLKTVANMPSLFYFDQNYDIVKLSYECHELATNTSI